MRYRVTCSRECRRERARRAKTGKGQPWSEDAKTKLSAKGQTENLKMGTLIAQQNPLTGPFETNYQALVWVIVSPEGIIYRVRNLNHWLRENAHLLPGTVEQARAGFMQIKRCMGGKTKRQVSQWKGWRLIGWKEPE